MTQYKCGLFLTQLFEHRQACTDSLTTLILTIHRHWGVELRTLQVAGVAPLTDDQRLRSLLTGNSK